MEATVCQKCARDKEIIRTTATPARCDQCESLVVAGEMYVIETDTFPPTADEE